MEKYFIVTNQSPLHKDYFDWINNFDQIRVLVNKFFEDNNMETTSYGFYRDNLCCVPTINDLGKLDKSLGKDIRDGLRPFKGNSKIQKSWLKLLKGNNIERKEKPYVPMYFPLHGGKMRSRIFDIDNVLYCSFEQIGDIDTPEGMIEIKASEFWKIIEDYEERELGKKDVAI